MKKSASIALLLAAILSFALIFTGCGDAGIGIIGGADGPTSVIVS